MDNQHTPKETDLAYLAGLIDGEGTVTLEKHGRRRKGNNEMGISPIVLVANTDYTLIQHTVNLFRKLGVNPYVKSQNPKKKNRRKKTCYWVTCKGLNKCKRILIPLLPYLVGKQAQARLILEWIESRGDTNVAKGKPYSDYDFQIWDKVKSINHRGVTDCGLRP